jgi:hypothetical protein
MQACKANYWPDKCITLDEAVKKFKGRCVFKQYIKNKPVRWGINFFCVCCSATSYLWNAYFYVGKNDDALHVDNDISITQETVMKLLQPLSGKNHQVYMDNYYSSIPLFNELMRMDIYATGTIRTNRKGLDKRVTMTKKDEKELKKKPGTTRFSSCGRLVYAAWFDKRAVHMLSTCHPPVGTDTVEHWYPAKRGELSTTPSGKNLKHISISPIVLWYRKWMGAVDRFDQFRAYIKLEMKTSKFWHVMLWFILESALVNAYVLYKLTRQLANLEIQYSHFQFRVAVARALAQEWEGMGCVFQPTKGVISPRTLLKTKPAKKVRVSFGLKKCTRFSSNDKHLSFMESIPKLEGMKSKCRQLVCICEDCPTPGRRVTKWCKECAAPLCFPNCFQSYHTPN